MTTYDVIRDIHILAGVIALGAFWTAASLRKGSPHHRTVGRSFLIAMGVVAITGVYIAIAAFQRGRPVFGSFLMYLVLIVVTPTWFGWRVLREKQDVKRYTGVIYHSMAWVNIAAGASMLALGIAYRSLLFGGLSAVGLLAGFFMLRFTRRATLEARWWVRRHYVFMLGAGVGTHVAFINIGLSRMLPPAWSPIALQISFALPLVAFLFARLWLDRKYGPRAPTEQTYGDVVAGTRV